MVVRKPNQDAEKDGIKLQWKEQYTLHQNKGSILMRTEHPKARRKTERNEQYTLY